MNINIQQTISALEKGLETCKQYNKLLEEKIKSNKKEREMLLNELADLKLLEVGIQQNSG